MKCTIPHPAHIIHSNSAPLCPFMHMKLETSYQIYNNEIEDLNRYHQLLSSAFIMSISFSLRGSSMLSQVFYCPENRVTRLWSGQEFGLCLHRIEVFTRIFSIFPSFSSNIFVPVTIIYNNKRKKNNKQSDNQTLTKYRKKKLKN